MPDHAAKPDFLAIFEATPGLYLILDPEFTIVAVNDAYCRATMTERRDLVGRDIFEAFPDNPDEPGATGVSNLRASLERVVKFRRPDAMAIQKYDIRRPASEGGGFEERHWSPLNLPVLNARGELAWIVHRVEDVTDLVLLRVKREASDRLTKEQALIIGQLRASNEELARQITENLRLDRERQTAVDAYATTEIRFQALADNLPGIVYRRIVEADGTARDTYISDGARRILGINPQAIVREGRSLLDYIHPDDKEWSLASRRDAGAKGNQILDEVRTLTQPGNVIRWWQINSRPTRLGNGAVQWDGIAIDVTDRKAAEQQLQQAIKMDAIGHLTGGVAHDFNNLLTVILANAETLTEELQSHGGLLALAEMTRKAAERGAELTNSLLAFARRQPLEPRTVDIKKLVSSMDGLIRRTLGEDIEMEFVHSAGLWQAVVDPAQLEATILNLAINARDAMPEGGRLTIETGNAFIDDTYSEAHNEVAPGQYVMICVTDTGTGMTPEVVTRAFEPFFSTKEPGKGTGLGLSMAFGFVKQSGGHIKIYSEVGHGTAMKIYLPRAQAAEQGQPAAINSASVLKGTETVLLVEDDNLVREHAENLLKGLGYKVLVADRAAAALPILEGPEHIDILFTDVVMPGGMGGKQLADHAAKIRPDVIVLFTSGYTENAIVHHGRLDPGVNLIRKPYGRRELAQKLRQLLDGKAAAQGAVQEVRTRKRS
jgi:PAS domain S-box-containing protein